MSIEVRAQNTLSMTSVKAIKDATDRSTELLATMEQYAEDAGTTLLGIYADAESAKDSAESATASAETALNQLTVVENVLGVLDLVAKHGTYALTIDTEVNPNKWYFTREGTSPDYVYVVVQTPSGNPSTEGWYELTGIDQAIQNYVSSQLYLDTAGLWLKTAGMNTKILLSTDGVVIYGIDGQPVASYGATAIIGNRNAFHIEIGDAYNLTKDTEIVSGKTYYTRSGTAPDYTYTEVTNPVIADIGTYYEKSPEIGFYQGDNKVARLNGSELYVENSLSFGSFVFTQRQNGHFTLKLLD